METIILNGKEYVLVPIEHYQAPLESPVPPQEATESFLEGFTGGEVSLEPETRVNDNTNIPAPLIRVMTQDSMGEIVEASAKPSTYREKYLKRELTGGDVSQTAKPNPTIITQFKDLPEIEMDKRVSSDKQRFYGPGVEYDF